MVRQRGKDGLAEDRKRLSRALRDCCRGRDTDVVEWEREALAEDIKKRIAQLDIELSQPT
jgi:hypothetical protein